MSWIKCIIQINRERSALLQIIYLLNRGTIECILLYILQTAQMYLFKRDGFIKQRLNYDYILECFLIEKNPIIVSPLINLLINVKIKVYSLLIFEFVF